MKRLVELLIVVTIVVGLGALVYAGFHMLSISNEVGSGNPEDTGPAIRRLYWAGGALVLYIFLTQLRKRLA